MKNGWISDAQIRSILKQAACRCWGLAGRRGCPPECVS
ncbi:MAG: hypothetical protein ACJA1F_000507 [Paracoccaceae bacterium]|jgi:hypothetical protein